MKKISIATILLLSLVHLIFSQDSESQGISLAKYMPDGNNIFGLSVATESVNRMMMFGDESKPRNINSEILIAILNLDVFSIYSDETKQFQSELSKKKFLESDSYKAMLNQVTDYKKRILETGINYQIRRSAVSDYNEKKKGFVVSLGHNYDAVQRDISDYNFGKDFTNDLYFWNTFSYQPKKSKINQNIENKTIGLKEYSIDVGCADEDLALKIENGIKDGSIISRLAILPIDPVKSGKFDYYPNGNFYSVAKLTKKDVAKSSADIQYVMLKTLKVQFVELSSGNVLLEDKVIDN
jgi:hypothetical protein